MPDRQTEQQFERILSLADPNALTQGEELFVDGAVVSARLTKGRLRADVEEGDGYRVTLDTEGVEEHSCECREALTGAFCKHLVAATLQWASKPSSNSKNRKPKADPTAAARKALGLLDREEIIDRLIHWSKEDAGLRERLDLLAARTSGRRIKTAPYKKAIRAATVVRKHLNRSEYNKVALQVRRVLGELRELLDQGAASAIVNLAEFTIERISKIAWRLDYGSDVSAELLLEAQQLHIAACEQEPPDQMALAAALFEWTTSGPDTRFISYEAYSAVLGEPGREAFRRLAEAEWDKFPVLKPSKNSYYFHYEDTGIRQRLTDLLKEMARADGDTDRLVEVCKKDISSPSNYLEIAEILEDADRIDEAIEWVRQSVETFPGRDVMWSQTLLAKLHHQAGRAEKAMDVIWKWFEEDPGEQSYVKVMKRARDTGREAEYREKALAYVRATIPAAESAPPHQQPKHTPYGRFKQPEGHTLLVEIFMNEGDLDAACLEMSKGGCRVDVALRLAMLLESERPSEAIGIYWSYIRSLLKYADQMNYQRALPNLQRIAELAERAGHQEEFQRDLTELRMQNKKRSTFIDMLNEAGLE